MQNSKRKKKEHSFFFVVVSVFFKLIRMECEQRNLPYKKSRVYYDTRGSAAAGPLLPPLLLRRTAALLRKSLTLLRQPYGSPSK